MRRVEGAAEKTNHHAALGMGHCADSEGRSRRFFHRRLGPDLSGAAHAVFERGQLLDADWSARVHLAGCDADLRPHAELAAIRKLRRGIVQQDR
jgi:hypothetical protein